jgi:hypothetical protein
MWINVSSSRVRKRWEAGRWEAGRLVIWQRLGKECYFSKFKAVMSFQLQAK